VVTTSIALYHVSSSKCCISPVRSQIRAALISNGALSKDRSPSPDEPVKAISRLLRYARGTVTLVDTSTF